MSTYFSKFSLNVYPQTPYFTHHIPPDYPLAAVLMKGRAFRRLPPGLQKLGELSKRWAVANGWDRGDIDDWYDANGNEIDPETGLLLTDQEIDDQWDSSELAQDLEHLPVNDVPEPDGGFLDPDTWQPSIDLGTGLPEPIDSDPLISPERLVRDVASRGREAVLKEYGLTDEEANDILVQYQPDPSNPIMIGGDAVVAVATGESYRGKT